MASTAFVRTRVDGLVAELQLDRAEALNALTPEMMDAIAGELESIDADRAARVVVIAGDDRAFVAGLDIRLLRERPLDAVLTRAGVKFWTRLVAIDVPLIAAVSGYALGGGCELALACDMIVASETAVFAQAEINLGIMPGGGGTQRLARTVGKYLAMEMVLTGRRVTAAEAYRMGFVNRVGRLAMTHCKEAAGRRQSGAGCPAWCVLAHDRDGQPTIVLHESLPAVIELSGLPQVDVRERVDVGTTQYSPEESGELPRTSWVELARDQDCR